MVKHEPETHNWLVRLVRTARADSLRTAEVLRPAPRPEAKGAQASDLHTSTVGPVGLDPTTCGFDIPDSRSTRHAPRGSSGGYDADRDPLSSANVPAKTSGGPRRARTDDLRIKRAISVCGLVRILLISCVIASQLFARRGGGSRARADSLRTPEVRGSTRCP